MALIFQQSATTAALKKMPLATLVSTRHLYRPPVNSDVLSVINNQAPSGAFFLKFICQDYCVSGNDMDNRTHTNANKRNQDNAVT